MNNPEDHRIEDLCPDCKGLLILKEDVKAASSKGKVIKLATIYTCGKCKSRWIRNYQEKYILRY